MIQIINKIKNLFKAEYATITVQEFEKKRHSKNSITLDVRRASEVSSGQIEGAINIDILSPEFKGHAEKLDLTKALLVYCVSGKRSASAAVLLCKLGAKEVYNIQGGILAYQKEIKV
jgi:rhodanese-related sulfurtransferase